MGSKNHVDVEFGKDFSGKLKTVRNSSINIGVSDEEIAPYEMLLGALTSCFYATFLDIAQKKKLEFEKVEFVVDSEKRDEIPAFLSKVNIKIIIYNAKEKSGFEKSFELAGKYCSVYQTILKVAEISTEITYE